MCLHCKRLYKILSITDSARSTQGDYFPKSLNKSLLLFYRIRSWARIERDNSKTIFTQKYCAFTAVITVRSLSRASFICCCQEAIILKWTNLYFQHWITSHRELWKWMWNGKPNGLYVYLSHFKLEVKFLSLKSLFLFFVNLTDPAQPTEGRR